MKYVIYVHGATRHLPNYSLPWFNTLKPYLGDTEVERVEVLYSDIMSPAMHWMPEWAFRRLIEAERRYFEYGDYVIPWSPGILDDILQWPKKRERVVNRVLEKLFPLLKKSKEVTVVCHSFGTIVMPEVAWELEYRAGDVDFHPIKNLIMWGGSPDVGPVVKQWESGKEDGWKVHRPITVGRVYNLGCYGDFASGPIDETIWKTVPGDVDQARRIPLIGKRDIPSAHCDGFNPENKFAQQLMSSIILRE